MTLPKLFAMIEKPAASTIITAPTWPIAMSAAPASALLLPVGSVAMVMYAQITAM